MDTWKMAATPVNMTSYTVMVSLAIVVLPILPTINIAISLQYLATVINANGNRKGCRLCQIKAYLTVREHAKAVSIYGDA